MSDVALSPRRLPPAMVYPIAPDKTRDWRDAVDAALTVRWAKATRRRRQAKLGRMCAAVDAYGTEFGALDDAGLMMRLAELRGPMRRDGLGGLATIRCFALLRVLSERHLGQRPRRSQIMAAAALACRMIGEMGPGEGKTLAVGLAAAAAALSGCPVHVITANEYLARRDHDVLAPLFAGCGLSVGLIVSGLSFDERRNAYGCDITYGGNKDVAMDFLRDQCTLGRDVGDLRLKIGRLCQGRQPASHLLMRGLAYAIVDEADAVLIDDTRTPLVMPGQTDPGDAKAWATDTLRIARALDADTDYTIDPAKRSVALTDAGRARLRALGEQFGGVWRNRLRREEAALLGVAALAIYHPDQHYVVREDRVWVLEDQTRGTAVGRAWLDGLHQLIELKEGCTVTGRRYARLRTTYQRFFRRYQHLCGLSAAVSEDEHELWSIYRLPVVRIDLRRPSRRTRLGSTICPSNDDKWTRVVARSRTVSDKGRPVLIGVRSLQTADSLAAQLDDAGLAYHTIAGKDEADEAVTLALAGGAGRITVVARLAGRGVDIPLDDGVANAGGLHVILAERNDTNRLDRQLFLRCSRRGEPGTVEEILSWDDDLLKTFGIPWPAKSRQLARLKTEIVGLRNFAIAQWRAARLHARIRRELMKLDQRTNDLLAFTAGRQ